MKLRYFRRAAARAAAKAATISLLAICAQPAFATVYPDVTVPETSSSILYTLTDTESLTVTATGSVNGASGATAVFVDSAALGVIINNIGVISSDWGKAIYVDWNATGTTITNRAGAMVSASTTAIYFNGTLDGSITNSGSITAQSTINSAYAYAIYAGDLNAGASIDNNGTISTINATAQASNGWASAYGVLTGSLGVGATINNDGTIAAQATGYYGASAYAIYTNDLTTGATSLTNSGSVRATAQSTGTSSGAGAGAYGIYMGTLGQDTSLDNSGAITAQATGYSWATAYGISMSGMADGASLANSGMVSTINATALATSGRASAYGIYMWDTMGQYASITNSGAITAAATGYSRASAYGVLTGSLGVGATINNDGAITAQATGYYDAYAYAIYTNDLTTGATSLTNSGSVRATAQSTGTSSGGAGAYGITTATLGQDTSLDNSGAITAQATGYSWATAYGISMSGMADRASLANSGTLSTIAATAMASNGYASAYGIYISNTLGLNASIANSGAIAARATGSSRASAYAIYTMGLNDGASIANNGTVSTINATAIATSGRASAYGVLTGSLGVGATINNDGTIAAQATGYSWASAHGISMSGIAAGATITNNGTITATATALASTGNPFAYGISTWNMDAGASITNNGRITAIVAGSGANNSDAYSIYVDSSSGGTVTNTGTLQGNIALNGLVNMINTGTLALPTGVSGYIGGDYTQNTGGMLQIGATSNNDYATLQVDGTATFVPGAAINVDVATVNSLAIDQTLADVVSAGTLAATTFAVSDNSTLFNFNALVDGNTVDLEIVKGMTVVQSLRKVGNTTGLGAAKVLDDLMAGGTTASADMNDVITALGTLGSELEVANAVQQTLPLLTGNLVQARFHVLRDTNRVVQDRLDDQSGLASGDEPSRDRRLWLKPLGSWADQGDRKNVSGFDSDTYGLMLGADTEIAGNSRLGAAFAYSASAVDSKSTVAPQNADITAYQLTVYGSHKLDADTGLDFNAGLGRNNTEGERTINFGGLNRVARADYDSTSANVGAGLGRKMAVGAKGLLVPSLRADYTWVRDDSYTETGAGALNLNVDRQTTDELIISLAGKYQHTLSEALKLNANLGVGYDFLSEQALITSSYVGGGAAFTTEGLEPSPWLMRGGLGLVMQQSQGLEFSVRYDAELREDFSNQTVSLKVLMPF